MSKDLATWQIHCLLQEVFHLNDAVINGDLTDKVASKRAQQWADEMKPCLLKLDRVKEAWVNCSISFGGLVCLSWEITWEDGETIRGSLVPVRK